MEDKFNSLELNHIPRCLNEAADALAKATSDREPEPTGVFDSDQHKPSVRYERTKPADDGPSALAPRVDLPMAPPNPKVMELEVDPTTEPDPPNDWRTLYIDYLLHDALPADKMEARRLARHTKSFVLVEGELYKRSHTGIL